ncbi:hypothetical protein EJ07DRAFT_160644 [Lizonia empirigonia]|nr:hypothetical protein EJ07DRAFT_160644 [Lizonia empirigonia]
MDHRWPLLQPRPGTPVRNGKPAHTVTEPAPYTPTKTSSLLQHHAPAHCATSTRSRARAYCAQAQLARYPRYHGTPTRTIPRRLCKARSSSCIAHFENLTSTRELTDDQMEYVTKKSTEDLFSGASSPRTKSPTLGTASADPESSYMAEVGRYIERVQIYTADLKRRFDEAKALNEIQLAIIDHLRKDMSSDTAEHAGLAGPKPAKAGRHQTDNCRRLVVVRKPVQPVQQGFWTALYEALDGFGNDFHER